MKKIYSVFLSLFLIFAITACGNAEVNSVPLNTGVKIDDTESGGEPVSQHENITLPIYDFQNKKIGEIEYYTHLFQISDGLIYAKCDGGQTDTLPDLDFYRYNLKTKEEVKLGSVENWTMGSNEVVFLDNHLFLMVVESPMVMKLLDFNLDDNTMTEIFSREDTTPLEKMIGVGNRLLFTISGDRTSVNEYNLDTKEIKELAAFDFDNEKNMGETVREISVFGDEISFLVLQSDAEGNSKLRVDTYDSGMNLLRSMDVSDITKDAVEADEIRQIVVDFEFFNDYLFYGNRSITSFLGTVAGGKATNFLNDSQTDLFCMATDAANRDDSKLFYRRLNYDDNALYLMDTKTGEIGRAVFNCADEPRYQISTVSRDADDNVLIYMTYRDPYTSEDLPPRAYYFNLSELEFSPVTSIDIPDREY